MGEDCRCRCCSRRRVRLRSASISGERPYTFLDRNDVTALLVTYERRGRGHLLVIPVHHRETILELNRDEQAAVMSGVV